MHYLKVEGSSVPFPREAYICQMCIFFNIVQTAFDPPPLVLNMYVANYFDRLLKKSLNVCRDKIRQKYA